MALRRFSLTIAICCICASFTFPDGAWADLYWDTNGSTAGGSNSTTADGDWYSPALNWSTDPTGKSTTKAWVSNETAVFSAGTNATDDYTVYIGSSVKLSGIRVEEGYPTITTVTDSGAALYAANLPIDVGSGLQLDLRVFFQSGPGVGLITKTGSGDLWTHQANTSFVGKWVINQGRLLIDNDFDLGAITTTTIPDEITLNGATLVFESIAASPDPHRGITLGAGGGVLGSPPLGATTLAVPITGDAGGALQLAGTFTLSNTDNNYDGPTIISGTALHLGASGVIPDTSVVNVGGGSTFDLHSFNETIKSLSSSGTSSVTLGTGTLTLANPVNELFTGTFTASAGGKIVENGAGKFILDKPNPNFHGEFVLNSGTLGISDNDVFGNTAGAQLTINGGTLANRDTTAWSSSANVAININADFTVDTTLRANPGSITLSGPATMNASHSITIGGAASFVLADLREISSGSALTKSGAGTLELRSGTYSGGTSVTAGTLLVNNTTGSATGSGPVTVSAAATITGTGIISGSVTNSGTIAPGAGVGTLTIGGSTTMSAGSHTAIDVSGNAADELVVGGGLSLSASSYLDVVGGGAGPWVISTYGGVLSGTFGHVTSGYAVDYATPGQLILKVIGLVGDYNSDGKVDSADYVVWRNDPTSFGAAGGYTNWRAHFGTHAGSGSATLETTVVPEPGTFMLLIAGALALCYRSILASLVRPRCTESI